MQNNHPFLLRIDLFDLLFCYETSYQTCSQISFNDEMILQSKCTGQYTVYVDYFICMCFRFPAQPQSLWEKKNVTTSFVCFNAFEETEEWETRSFNLAQNTLITAAFRGWFALLLGRIEVGFLELRYESSTLILYKELSSPIFQSLSVSE